LVWDLPSLFDKDENTVRYLAIFFDNRISSEKGVDVKEPRTYSISLNDSAKVGVLEECPIFRDLSQEDSMGLAHQATAVVFAKGSFIFKEGDPANFFYIVYDGLVQVYKTSGSGKNVTFTIATRGDTLTASALSIENYFVSTQCMNDVTVLRIAKKDFLSFLSTHNDVAMAIIAIMARRLNREYERIVDIVGEEVELRLVHSLCLLASKFGSTLSLTRQELANFAGTTTETTIRVLSRLKKRGVISGSASRGEIIISDLKELQNSAF
jgi:CRP/FNR family transcriptional regulator, cyclic AMP receptor protein